LINFVGAEEPSTFAFCNEIRHCHQVINMDLLTPNSLWQKKTHVSLWAVSGESFTTFLTKMKHIWGAFTFNLESLVLPGALAGLHCGVFKHEGNYCVIGDDKCSSFWRTICNFPRTGKVDPMLLYDEQVIAITGFWAVSLLCTRLIKIAHWFDAETSDETTDTFLCCQLVPNQEVISPKQGSHEVHILGLVWRLRNVLDPNNAGGTLRQASLFHTRCVNRCGNFLLRCFVFSANGYVPISVKS